MARFAPTRFRELRARLNLTQSDVARRLGVTKQAVSAYETGRARPDPAAVKGLLSEAGLTADWLFGLDDAPPPGVPTGAAPRSHAALRRLGLVRIPALTIEAGAGPGVEPTVEATDLDGGLILSEQQARRQFGVAVDRLHTIRVRGDSMAPTLMPGDEVVVARLDPGALLVDGAVYALLSPEGVLIKRLRFATDYEAEGGAPRRWVRIVSDNPAADTYRVPAEVFERDYRVVAAFLTVHRSL